MRLRRTLGVPTGIDLSANTDTSGLVNFYTETYDSTGTTMHFFSAQGIIDINLSAQTGYSAQTDIDYAFNDAAHPWCGFADVPAGNSELQTIHQS
jgi:hypothetical protein